MLERIAAIPVQPAPSGERSLPREAVYVESVRDRVVASARGTSHPRGTLAGRWQVDLHVHSTASDGTDDPADLRRWRSPRVPGLGLDGAHRPRHARGARRRGRRRRRPRGAAHPRRRVVLPVARRQRCTSWCCSSNRAVARSKIGSPGCGRHGTVRNATHRGAARRDGDRASRSMRFWRRRPAADGGTPPCWRRSWSATVWCPIWQPPSTNTSPPAVRRMWSGSASATSRRSRSPEPLGASPYWHIHSRWVDPSTGTPLRLPRVSPTIGLIGVEVDYSTYTPEERMLLRRIARDAGLLPSGGSDYHGSYKPEIAARRGHRGTSPLPGRCSTTWSVRPARRVLAERVDARRTAGTSHQTPAGPSTSDEPRIRLRPPGTSMGRAALLVGAGILISRLLGFRPQRRPAGAAGTERAADLYNAAFVIPDYLFFLMAGGYLSITFVPILSRHIAAGDDEERVAHLCRGVPCRWRGDGGADRHRDGLCRPVGEAPLSHLRPRDSRPSSPVWSGSCSRPRCSSFSARSSWRSSTPVSASCPHARPDRLQPGDHRRGMR